MKHFIFSLIIFGVAMFSASAQREFAVEEGDTTYTMKRYVFMLLDQGPTPLDESTEKVLQEGHLNHLNMLAEQGKLILAGPFEGGKEHKGLLIFDVETVEEALKLEGDDPKVEAGRLKMNAFYWWGAKGTILK